MINLGRRHGLGRCYFSNGDVYNGNWKKDGMDGKGYYSWKSTSSIYLGHWLDTNRHGNGVYAMNSKSKASEENKNKEKCRTILEFVCGKWKNDFVANEGQIKYVEAW